MKPSTEPPMATPECCLVRRRLRQELWGEILLPLTSGNVTISTSGRSILWCNTTRSIHNRGRTTCLKNQDLLSYVTLAFTSVQSSASYPLQKPTLLMQQNTTNWLSKDVLECTHPPTTGKGKDQPLQLLYLFGEASKLKGVQEQKTKIRPRQSDARGLWRASEVAAGGHAGVFLADVLLFTPWRTSRFSNPSGRAAFHTTHPFRCLWAGGGEGKWGLTF